MAVEVESGVGALCAERDALAFRRVVERALFSARRQLHRGRRCPGESCDPCAEVVGAAYEVALLAYRAEANPHGWSPAKIAAVARNAYIDRVRRRLSASGIGARPQRWLGQRSFLPEETSAGRVLVVGIVLAVGYFSVVPSAGTRILVDDDVLGRVLDGLRPGAGGLAAARQYWTYRSDRDSVPELRRHAESALAAWRVASPDRYAGLLTLNEANAALWASSFDDPGLARWLPVARLDGASEGGCSIVDGAGLTRLAA
ncbi:MAG: hypothetical protein ACRDTG_18025 [Pseudonocardiaceae bacterium]